IFTSLVALLQSPPPLAAVVLEPLVVAVVAAVVVLPAAAAVVVVAALLSPQAAATSATQPTSTITRNARLIPLPPLQPNAGLAARNIATDPVQGLFRRRARRLCGVAPTRDTHRDSSSPRTRTASPRSTASPQRVR